MKSKLKIYDNHPNAPIPTVPLTPGTCAVIVDEKKRIFLHKRSDSTAWALPGGTMELGESISQCCIREVAEEASLNVSIKRLVGIYTSPKCIFDFGDGNIFQSFVVAFLCNLISGEVRLNDESSEHDWFKQEEIFQLDTVPFVKEIIADGLTKREAIFD